MFIIFLINHLFACEFELVYKQQMEKRSYDIPQVEYITFGTWTRFYAFYLDFNLYNESVPSYSIIQGTTYNNGEYLFLQYQDKIIHYFGEEYSSYRVEFLILHPESYEGVWMFTYIEFDQNNKRINIILLNTKTNQFEKKGQVGKFYQINSIKLFEQDNSRYPFSGQISFTFIQSQQVRFDKGEQLLAHLKSCNMQNSCTLNSRYQILSGIMDKFDGPFNFQMQNNYWIDGWFKFTPNSLIQQYNNLILQIVQYNKEVLQYNGIIPLKIILNFDKSNLTNNGIIVETSSFKQAKWNDIDLNLIKILIFNESYLKLIQNWVYFRFLQYEQNDHTAEFYLSFSDSSEVTKNMGQLNLFKYGRFFIYLGQSDLNQNSFIGQLANFNIQSCLQTYPLAKKNCHSLCLTCTGPLENNCLSCVDQTQTNRILNPYTNTCDCKAGFISVQEKAQCIDIQTAMKSATFKQFQVQQSQIQPCKDGQFQYQIGQSIKCFDCPQQSSAGIFCADCIENLSTWQKSMKCSYDYYQENNNNNNTYIKYSRSQNQIEFYFVQDDLLLICLGCNLDEGSYLIFIDKTSLQGTCHQNYYYLDYQCHPCQQNCESCDDETGRCNSCKIGFELKNVTGFNYQFCNNCPDYCLKCSQLFNNSFCSDCLDGFTPGEGICQKCGTNCLICDYEIKLNRPKCRVCKYNYYFLPFDGFDCVQNTIKDCQIQYQSLIQYLYFYNPDIYNTKTTLGFENIYPFEVKVETIINKCALCDANYINGDTYCEFNSSIKQDDQIIIKNNYDKQCCIKEKCSQYYFEEDGIRCQKKILSYELINLLQYSNSQFAYCQIGYCTQCIKVQNKILKCINCFQGYYAEILSGLCFSCPSSFNCQTCQQQNRYYKDGWKWRIRTFSNYLFKSDLVSSQQQSDYEIICLTCLEGYMLYNDRCILNCPNNCNRCSIINGENVCTFCGSNNYSKLLTIYNNQCINCPQNCEFCKPRSQRDVYAINSLFNPNDPSKYYYSYICLKQNKDVSISFNQFIQQYIKCQDELFCMNQINIKLKAHCDLDYYSIQKSQSANNEDFYNENIFIDSNMPFSKIETPQFFEYLNGIQVESLIYELTLISPSNGCKIFNVITTHAPKNVFSLIKTKLIINANNLTINSLSGQIQNFSEVEIKSCKFNSSFYLQLYHPNEMIVRFKDISFVSNQINDIQIMIMNPSTIEINNFQIQSIQQLYNSQNNILSYEYTNTSNVKQLNIMMDSLSLFNGSFNNVDFLNIKADSRIQQLMINITNSVIESRFYNSSFIKEQSLTNYGTINLNNVTFRVQVEQASLINLNGQLKLYTQIKLIGTFRSSNFIRTHQLNITNSFIHNTSINNSTLIDNKILKQDYQIDIHEINYLEFKSVSIDVSSNFITLIDKNVQDQLLINNLQMIECSFINKKQTKTQQRLLIFEGAIFKIFYSLFQKNILGFTDISIKQCKSVIIDNVTVVGINVQGLQQKLDCYQEVVQISSQNGFIELENVQTVQILNSHFSNIMIQDKPIIRIFCFDNSIKQLIQIINTNFSNNLILKTESSSQNALFQLLSLGSGNLYAINVSFTENILHEYQQTQFQYSATTILVEADQFNITLNNTIFNKNQIFNSSDSILYIEAKIIVIQHSIFTQSNLYDDFILPYVLWGSALYNFYQENFQEIFPILSKGGNGKFIADNLFIAYCQFSHSSSQQGSGFHLTLQNELLIQDTSFIGLRSKVDQDDSLGGSLYIDLVANNAKIEIKNSKFENTSSLNEGGAIYIYTRYTSNISLLSVSVYNCYSFKGAFISVYLDKYSTLNIVNISVRNNQQGFKDFLSQFVEISDNQVEQFHSTCAIFYVEYGSLFISNSIISDIQLSGVLYFYSPSQLSIYDIVIQNNQFSSQGLIQIFPTSNMNTITNIQNVKILNCSSTYQQRIFCQVDFMRIRVNFQCQNYENYKPSSLISYPQDLKEKAECFYNKLLKFIPSPSILYIGMIQVTDYLHISDFIMRNNSCFSCQDGMIRIKNVNINITEFNNIILRQIKFENNICGLGCLVISQYSEIKFPTRRLLQNLLYKARFSIPFTVTLEQSEFYNNRAQNGILIINDLSISMIETVFIKNIGFDISGGILFLSNQDHNFQIMKSEFSENTGYQGGAFYLGNKTISSIKLLQILLSSNKAISYGQDLVGMAQGLTILLDGGKTFKQIKYVSDTHKIIEEIIMNPYIILGNDTLQQFLTLPSGQKLNKYQYYNEKSKSFTPYNLSLRLIALNNLKEQVYNLKNSFCTLQKRKININTNDDGPFEVLAQKIEFNTTSQDYNLDELVINFDPYYSYDYVLQLKFNCSSISIPIINNSSPYNIIGYSHNYELKINIRTFQCQRGEIYDDKQGTCNLCDSSQSLYSVVIKATSCIKQDEITMQNVTSTLIQLKENYWRPYDDNNIVTYCYNFPDNCKGGWKVGDESCAQGHIGALCEQCDLYNTRGSGSYATSGQFQCGSCSDLSLNTLQISLIIIWTLISIFLSVKGTVENVDQYIIRMKGARAGFVCVYFERAQIAVLIKILTNYLQIISTIGTFRLQLPPGLKSMFTYSGNPIKSAMNSIDCFLIGLSNIQILYFRNIWFVFLPIFYSTVIFLIYFLLIRLKQMEFKITVISTTLIFIFIYVQPDIIGSFISLLSYRKISDVYWVQGNVSYLYLTTVHTRWILSFVLPIIILFGFVIPIIIYIKMSKYKDRLNDTFVLRLYGYLYNEYSKVAYYWEIVKICQKELIIIFLTVYEDIIIIKGSIIFIITFFYNIFSKKYKPYQRVDLNKLDSQSSFICGFSIVLGMAIYFADQNGNAEILWPFYILMGIFNIYFILRLIQLLVVGYFDKLSDKIDQIRDYINNKYPTIIEVYPQFKKYLENSQIRSKRVKQRFLKLRKYLWKIVEENRNKNKRQDTDFNQFNQLKEANQSINLQSQKQKSKKYSLASRQEIEQDQICVSMDNQKQNDREFQISENFDNEDSHLQKNQKQNESIQIEIEAEEEEEDIEVEVEAEVEVEEKSFKELDYKPEDKDIQNKNEDEELLSLSFQQ